MNNACEIKLTFYRNSRNAKKLAGMVENFTDYNLPADLQEICSITIHKDSTADDLARFVHFWGVVKKYKDTALLTNGTIRTKEKAKSILDWIRCYCNQTYFEDQSHYCSLSKSKPGWGCKHLHNVYGRFGAHNGVHWYNIGPFLNMVQYIDKHEIKRVIEQEAEIKCLALCPCFSLAKAFQYVDLLPDQIDPQNEPEWAYVESGEVANPHEIVGVEPKPIDIFSF